MRLPVEGNQAWRLPEMRRSDATPQTSRLTRRHRPRSFGQVQSLLPAQSPGEKGLGLRTALRFSHRHFRKSHVDVTHAR
jgi:hypothetical protein